VTDNTHATIINDRYEIHKRIGRGGMADVFSARDLLLDRQVAIKVLFPEFATDENFVERFRREAQSAANLSHPNIVNVYDWGKYEGTYFIAMEEVKGRTLSDVLKQQGQLTSKQSAEVASEVAAALGFAHANGVAHRDIKPANILIGSNGQVKVADFGIARMMNAPTEANLTQAGSVMGTATYFSPEQAQGAQPDPRSDLYSLGIVMYEMVAGRPPFTGENPVSIAYKQVHDAPQPLVQLVADVPRSFEAIVAKLLAKDPKVRYQTAESLRDDLRRFRNGEPVEALTAAATAQGRPAGGAPAVPSGGMVEAGYPRGASAEAAYYDTSSGRTGWYALAAFVALIALVVGGVLLFQALSRDSGDAGPSEFLLPDYADQPLENVLQDIRSKGLRATTIEDPDPSFPTGFVTRTDPVAGTLMLEDQLVQVFYNPDPQLRPIPNVVGLSFDEASTRLEEAGFSVGEVTTEESSEVAEGTVLASDPTAETPALQGTEVDLTVAGAPDGVPVPDSIVGLTEIEARQILESPPYEFVVTTALRSSETIPVGTVLEINPSANTVLPVGSDVTIIVSSGPEPISVPAVVGQTEGAAVNTLQAAGLVPTVQYTEVSAGSPDDGRVVAQSLSAGTAVEPNTPITITVGQANSAVTTTSPPTTAAPTTTVAPTTTAAPTTTLAPTTTAAPTGTS
jgi:beta-lactam-binding protein with PASTA domain/predicted Ser/Thr protein kinase